MQKQLMLVRDDPSQVMFVVNCGCDYSIEHSWTMICTNPIPDMPDYMEIEVLTHSEVGYDNFWRRLRHAWDILVHRWYHDRTTFVMKPDQIAAFEKGLRIAKARVALAGDDKEKWEALKERVKLSRQLKNGG